VAVARTIMRKKERGERLYRVSRGGEVEGFFCDLRGQLVQVLYKHGG